MKIVRLLILDSERRILALPESIDTYLGVDYCL